MKQLLLRRLARLAAFALLLLAAASASALPADGATPVNNREYAQAVRKLIQGAKHSLRIMLYQARFYPEYPDTVTNYFIDDLIAARQRGVDVKILVDTGVWNPNGKNEHILDFVDRLTTAGVEIWQDADEDVSHQKVMLVDDDITLVASHNWTYYSVANNNEVAVIVYSRPLNEWFKGYFRDLCRLGTPRANATSATLDAEPSPPGRPGLKEIPGLRRYPVASVEPAANRLFYPVVRDAMLSATKSIDIVQRSIVLYDQRPWTDADHVAMPGEPASMTNVLAAIAADAHRRGLRVRVVLDNNENFPTDDNDQTARFFLERGVEVFRDDLKVQTHAKMLLLDDDKVVVGSTNWTYPAFEKGNEASVLITSPELARVYRDYVDAIIQAGASYSLSQRSIWDDKPQAPADPTD
ncbi:MAG: phospholipase D-like domain-containing protein [Candidatus Sumerlaeaceae bacterium]|nr:phospholipase D-like domain-containing protein [Candidatus Sumerlaeaceae bacterium]